MGHDHLSAKGHFHVLNSTCRGHNLQSRPYYHQGGSMVKNAKLTAEWPI